MENYRTCIVAAWLSSMSVLFCVAVYVVNTLVYMDCVVTLQLLGELYNFELHKINVIFLKFFSDKIWLIRVERICSLVVFYPESSVKVTGNISWQRPSTYLHCSLQRSSVLPDDTHGWMALLCSTDWSQHYFNRPDIQITVTTFEAQL